MAWNSGPWANNGETVDATETENGQIQTTMTNTEHTEISSPNSVPVATADAIRKALLNGKTAQTLSENYPYSAAGISEIAKRNDVVDGSPTQPKTEWRNNQIGWVEADNENDDLTPRDSKPAQAKYIRSKLLDGNNYSDLVDEGFEHWQVKKAAKGLEEFDGIDCDIGPLEYKGGGDTPTWVETDSGRDNKEKGLNSFGKLFNESEVAELRKRLLEGETGPQIAEEYNCTKKPIYNAARGDGEYSGLDVTPCELKYEGHGQRGEWIIRDGQEAKNTETKDKSAEPEPESEPTLEGQSVSKQPSTDSMNYYKAGAVVALVYIAYRTIRGVFK